MVAGERDGSRPEPTVIMAGVRDGGEEWHIECRMSDGQKGAFVVVDREFPNLASKVAHALTHDLGEAAFTVAPPAPLEAAPPAAPVVQQGDALPSFAFADDRVNRLLARAFSLALAVQGDYEVGDSDYGGPQYPDMPDELGELLALLEFPEAFELADPAPAVEWRMTGALPASPSTQGDAGEGQTRHPVQEERERVMRDALQAVEWGRPRVVELSPETVRRTGNTHRWVDSCPACTSPREAGHAAGCVLDAALSTPAPTGTRPQQPTPGVYSPTQGETEDEAWDRATRRDADADLRDLERAAAAVSPPPKDGR